MQPTCLDSGNPVPFIDPLLLTCTRIGTFAGSVGLTSATGFFLVRDQRLFLVTSRHVFIDEEAKHFPDRITIELHVNRDDMAEAATRVHSAVSRGLSLWRQAVDSAGEVDVALIEVDQSRTAGGGGVLRLHSRTHRRRRGADRGRRAAAGDWVSAGLS